MNAAERRRIAYERHRDFLLKVTGMTFSAPFQSMSGLVFRARGTVRPNGRAEALTLCSVVSEREGLAQ